MSSPPISVSPATRILFRRQNLKKKTPKNIVLRLQIDINPINVYVDMMIA